MTKEVSSAMPSFKYLLRGIDGIMGQLFEPQYNPLAIGLDRELEFQYGVDGLSTGTKAKLNKSSSIFFFFSISSSSFSKSASINSGLFGSSLSELFSQTKNSIDDLLCENNFFEFPLS